MPSIQATAPSPDLAPEDVVRIQVELLRTNDDSDQGIAGIFAFASPENQAQTGPLERFVAMVRAVPYGAMLRHREARFGPIVIGAAEARQTVTLVSANGATVAYLWIPSRREQRDECGGCWVTDTVIPIERDEALHRVQPSGPVT